MPQRRCEQQHPRVLGRRVRLAKAHAATPFSPTIPAAAASASLVDRLRAERAIKFRRCVAREIQPSVTVRRNRRLVRNAKKRRATRRAAASFVEALSKLFPGKKKKKKNPTAVAKLPKSCLKPAPLPWSPNNFCGQGTARTRCSAIVLLIRDAQSSGAAGSKCNIWLLQSHYTRHKVLRFWFLQVLHACNKTAVWSRE